MGSWEITPHGRNKGAEAWRGQKEGSWDQEEADRWASGAPAGHALGREEGFGEDRSKENWCWSEEASGVSGETAGGQWMGQMNKLGIGNAGAD